MDTALLSLQSVQLKQGQRSFGPFDIQIRPGERVAILGPSGAGKSTLLKGMAGELPARSGRAELKSRALVDWSLSALSQHRAVLPQSHEVAFGLPAELVIGLGRVARLCDPALQRIVREAAELACASHLLRRQIDTLSGGERARVQLARVFAQLWDVEGGLVLVDEPLAALDPGLQLQLLEAIDQFADVRGHAVVAVLHDVNHALQAFERLILVRDGQQLEVLASDAQALPVLEKLYGVTFAQAVSSQGDLIVAPVKCPPLARQAA